METKNKSGAQDDGPGSLKRVVRRNHGDTSALAVVQNAEHQKRIAANADCAKPAKISP